MIDDTLAPGKDTDTPPGPAAAKNGDAPEEAFSWWEGIIGVYEWARRYRKRGIAIVPIADGEKRPMVKDWTLQSAELSDFTGSENIGILTGALSGDLVCIDLDDPKAVELADQYLPPTGMIEGRPGKPRSHRYYRVTNIPPELTATTGASGEALGGPATRKAFLNVVDLAGKAKQISLLEILGTGRQATAPPSSHPSREHREWDEFGEPAVIDYQELYDTVNKLVEDCSGHWGANVARSTAKPQLGVQKPARALKAPAGAPRYYPGLPSMEDRVARARAYVSKVEEAVDGEGGHNKTFHVACLLVRDFALDEENARALLDEYNQRCDPLWTADELDHKFNDANAYSGRRGKRVCKPRSKAGSCEPVADAITNPHRLAKAFLQQTRKVDGLRRWSYWRQDWWYWQGKTYCQVPLAQFESQLNRFLRKELKRATRAWNAVLRTKHMKQQELDAAQGKLKKKAFKETVVPPVTSKMVHDVRMALQGLVLVDFAIDQPCWLKNHTTTEQRPLIALANGLLDVERYLAGEACLQAHTPRWFSPVCLPYAWDAQATCPRWLAALQLIFADPERIDLLQEWFGYCLLPGTDLQRFLMFVGEGSNGKSVLCAALEAVLGNANVSHVGLESFGERFALGATIGKLANIVAEIGDIDKTAEGQLKAFVSGDPMTIDRKNRDAITVVPGARLVFATNTVPTFKDKSSGLWRRLMLVPCDVVIPEDKKVIGMDKVAWWEDSGELPGMLMWALEGLRRLGVRKRFTEPAASQKAKADHRLDSNPAQKFLTECCERDQQASTLADTLYEAYTEWCEVNGFGHPLASNNFGKEIRRFLNDPECRKYRSEGRGQPRKYCYLGIRLASRAQPPDPSNN